MGDIYGCAGAAMKATWSSSFAFLAMQRVLGAPGPQDKERTIMASS